MTKEHRDGVRMQDGLTDFLLYTTPQGGVTVEVLLNNETIWLTQQRMATLFGVDRSVISKHLQNIFLSEELDKEVVCAKIAHTTQHGALANRTQTQSVTYYNLDAIISVGYRVHSRQATQFRIWATRIIQEYLIKGFAMDDTRLKYGGSFGKNYFGELLERIRSIRASERHIYQKITDIFAECSTDYDPHAEVTQQFYAHVQNKFHYAITGQTAAEIIYYTADSNKPLMGMTTYKHAPSGRILKSDTVVAKNYLSADEIRRLERTVSAFFDYIEGIIEKRHTFTMDAFSASVDKFLTFNEYKIIHGGGRVSHVQAVEKANAEYAQFNKRQKIVSDFDRRIKVLGKKPTSTHGKGNA